MSFIREISIAVRIVIITLWPQSVGLAALIHWESRRFAAAYLTSSYGYELYKQPR